MKVNRIVTAMVAGCAVLVLSAVPGLAAQTPQEHQPPATAKVEPASGMAAKCQAMMDAHEKMMTDLKLADQRLDSLVVTMNTASSTAKSAATATVVTEMVTQDRAMRAGMMKMHRDMVGHTAEHMRAGKDSMAMCPMTKK